ncbi:cell wall hydrolase [Parvularcula maris]|uniref:Cell wall hydrolase n=1 Tax=Parvularcula maris TaxID=2965077 RepID=A0A9X2RIW7_9PROT|nr:cell wall hydrolase [Parvularcula maris]MCQ8185296.1 cell wall hydrolase [Parvularcula maris]
MGRQGRGSLKGRKRGMGLAAGAVAAAAASTSFFSMGSATVSHSVPEWQTFLFHDAALELSAFDESPLTSAIDLLTEAGFDGGSIASELVARGVPGVSFVMDEMPAEPSEKQAAERFCLAQAIYYEARNQPVTGRLAVADVVLNRADDHRFPSTICGVVFQGVGKDYACQFSFACDGSMDKPREAKAWEQAEKLADLVYRGFRPAVTGFATFYHADYVDPSWSRRYDETQVIGDHIFYRLPDSIELAAADLGMAAAS